MASFSPYKGHLYTITELNNNLIDSGEFNSRVAYIYHGMIDLIVEQS